MKDRELLVRDKHVLEMIRDIISSCKMSSKSIDNIRFHHSTGYKEANSIITNGGIYSLIELNRRGIVHYTPEELKKFDDIDSHINGNDEISLAVMGLTDLYRDEDEFDPTYSLNADFRIDDVKAARITTRYGNEFVTRQSILLDKIKAMDVRMIQSTNEYSKDLGRIVSNYNYLIQICSYLYQHQIDMTVREKSYDESNVIDISNMSSQPRLILKKNDN